MKTAHVVIIAIVIMSMFMISDAGRCKKKLKKLQAEIKKLEKLREENKKLQEENKKLQEENKNLTSVIESLTNETEHQVEGLEESSILGSVDRKYVDQLVSYLLPVLQSSSSSKFKRCWHGNTDGWAASTFHSNCDGKGPTVTIIKVGDYIFGGYSDLTWYHGSICDYASSSKAFIYSLYNINGYAPVKREKKANSPYTVYRCYQVGPTFGNGHDIFISNNAASNSESYTYCGEAFLLPPGYSTSGNTCTFYAGSHAFTPTDIEVFYETTT